eukprot:gene1425-biopygen12276
MPPTSKEVDTQRWCLLMPPTSEEASQPSGWGKLGRGRRRGARPPLPRRSATSRRPPSVQPAVALEGALREGCRVVAHHAEEGLRVLELRPAFAFSCVRVQLRPAFRILRSAFRILRSASSCVQNPAFSCVLRSAAFCVQLRSAFTCVLRSAAFCVRLRSADIAGIWPEPVFSGDGVEIMAKSDNVVRAGLTPKFKDAETLLGMMSYNPAAL